MFRVKTPAGAVPTLAPPQLPQSGDPAKQARDQYFQAAAKWDNDRLRSMEVSRNRAVLMAVMCLLVTAALGFALTVMVANHKVEVVTIAFNEQTNTVRPVRYSDEVEQLTSREGFIKNQAYQFLMALESWSGPELERNWSTVAVFSDPQLLDRFRDSLVKLNTEALADKRARRLVTVHSMQFLNPTTLHVQFATQDGSDAAPGPGKEWASVINFRFSGRPGTVEQAMANPFGFQVTGYVRNDAASP